MSLAADARDAVRDRPFLLTALRAGVVNYRAAAEYLDVGDPETVAAALRRFADDLPDYDTESCGARVRMQSGVGLVEDPADPTQALLAVGDQYVVPEGEQAALLATGDVDGAALATVLARLDAREIAVDAAGVTESSLVVVVPGRARAKALQVVEAALDTVPTPPE